jgi:hypothetical protein
LLQAGYAVHPSRRDGNYWSLAVRQCGDAFSYPGEVDTEATGRSFQGRGLSGLLDIPPFLGERETARWGWEELSKISQDYRDAWPGAGFGPSVASMAIASLKTQLQRDLGLYPPIARLLRAVGVYGGGRIEYYPVGRAKDFRADAGDNLWSVDLSGAYARALQTEPIGVEYLGTGLEHEWDRPGCMTTALIEVPESLYPPLRFETHETCRYPWGTLFGTWTSSELRAAVACGVKVLYVHEVKRFEVREELAEWADRCVTLRRSAPHGSSVERFAKALVVQGVGALASRSSETKVATKPDPKRPSAYQRNGIWEIDWERPSQREVLSAAIFVTGIVRSWVALVLHALESMGILVIYCHTDGLACLGDPRPALDWAAEHGAPPSCAWKVNHLQRLEISAANQRIETDEHGVENLVAGGISKDLGPSQVRAKIRSPLGFDTIPTEWQASHRVAQGPWTRAPEMGEVDEALAERFQALARKVQGRAA